MLLNKTLYSAFKFTDCDLKNQISTSTLLFPSFKWLFDLLFDFNDKTIRPETVRLGFRKLSTNALLELFIFPTSLIDHIKKLQSENIIKIITTEVIKGILTSEGFIRSTLVPFNPSRDKLIARSVFNLSDYKRRQFNRVESLHDITSPFIEVSNQLTFIKKANLFRPLNLTELQSKSIYFEEHEVIYLHKWPEK
jgi:hypothetical protein